MSLTGNFGFMGSTGTKGTECSSLGVIGSTGATGAVGVEPFRAIQDLFPSKHKIEGWQADVPFTTDGPATRLEFGGGAGPIDMTGVFEDYANVHTPTHTELTRQISLLQRQNVVVEKAMRWYMAEAAEWKALALLMRGTQATSVASSPHGSLEVEIASLKSDIKRKNNLLAVMGDEMNRLRGAPPDTYYWIKEGVFGEMPRPAPDVAAAMRSPHADGFGACNPLVVR